MKKLYYLTITFVLVLAMAAVFPDAYHNARDRLVWQSLKNNIHIENVKLVTIASAGNAPFSPGEEDEVVKLLRKAQFKESNWRHFGPTPEVVIRLEFVNGVTQSFGYWGGGVFEFLIYGEQGTCGRVHG